ncbi:MAG TPA: beta-ketoacyl-ACP synthase III [Gemmatimonadales bacterium]|jgi:3-oxoacyl-[acyl-carrier-protein] synthase-3|nr:beta-ketoacyl-ACP synthase III [Gemmatimonadales bacterium]
MSEPPYEGSRRAAITGVATYAPQRVVTNADLTHTLDTSDEWIVSRTGIRERRIGAPGETTSTMGAEAVRRLMAAKGLGPDEVDLLIVATVTPDMLFPATACLIQDQVGLTRAWGFDLSAACSGFLYALTTGAQFIAAGAHRRVVVVGADLMSAIIDPTDRTTAVLFGDGAGAVLLEPAADGFGILDFHHRVDGSGRDDLLMPAGGSLRPASAETVAAREHFLRQNGRVVFKFAVSQMAGSVELLLRRNGLTAADLAVVIPHQANQRILDATADRLGLPRERMASVIGRYGNTTAATLPLALEDVLQAGRLSRGDLAVFVAVGAGFTVGATLVRWDC